MEDEQTPIPTEPWVTRSVWSFAPALFFYELFALIAWLVIIGALLGVSTALVTLLPLLGYLAHQMGAKCATEETAARVPRGRLWGTSLIVSLLAALFMYMLFQDFLLDLRTNSPDEFGSQMTTFFTDSSLPQEQMASMSAEEKIMFISLSVSLVIFCAWMFMHVIALWLGVRSVERVKR